MSATGLLTTGAARSGRLAARGRRNLRGWTASGVPAPPAEDDGEERQRQRQPFPQPFPQLPRLFPAPPPPRRDPMRQQARWLRKPPTNVPPAYRRFVEGEGGGGGGGGGGGETAASGGAGGRARRRSPQRGGEGRRRASPQGKKRRRKKAGEASTRAYKERRERRKRREAPRSDGKSDGESDWESDGEPRESEVGGHGSLRTVDELQTAEEELCRAIAAYDALLRGGDESSADFAFDDLGSVRRRRREDSERRGAAPSADGGGDGDGSAPRASLASVLASEGAYREVASLLRRLASGWAGVRFYTHKDQLDGTLLPPVPMSSGGAADFLPGSWRRGRGRKGGLTAAERAWGHLDQLEEARLARVDAIRRVAQAERRRRREAPPGQIPTSGGEGFMEKIGQFFGFGNSVAAGGRRPLPQSSADLPALERGGEEWIDGVTAHKSPAFVADKQLYKETMKSYIHWSNVAAAGELGEANADDGSDTRDRDVDDGPAHGQMNQTERAASQALAQRLRYILKQMKVRVETGNPHVSSVADLEIMLLTVLVKTGDAYAAHKVLTKLERKAKEEPAEGASAGSGIKLHHYHLVLQAYLNLVSDPGGQHGKKNARAAIDRAEKLVLDLVEQEARVEDVVPHTGTYNYLLSMFSKAGHSTVPNLCDRVDAIVQRMLGSKDAFQNFVGESQGKMEQGSRTTAPNNITKHLLIGIYSGKGGYVERSKHLLRSLENTRKKAAGSSEGQSGSDIALPRSPERPLPNTETYNYVIRSLLHSNGSPRAHASASSELKLWVDGQTGQDTFKEDAEYATDLLSSMVRHDSSLPTRFTYNYVLRLWAKSGSTDAGEYAEEILSCMEVRTALCDSSRFSDAEFPKPDALSYQNAMACWGVSALKSRPGAAKRAMLLLDKMEAQCIPIHGTRIGEHSANAHVYNEAVRPNRFVFTTLIMASACTQLEADKGDALRIAFDVYNRMIDRGVNPTSETYANLLKCCKSLLPDSQYDQRNQLSQTVFEAARDHGQVNRHVLSCLRDANPVLYDSYQA